MKPIKTLRGRFTLWLTALILVILTAFGGFVYFAVSRSLYSAVDDVLVLSAEQVLASLREEDGSLQIHASANALDLVEFNAYTQRGLTLILLSQKGDILQAAGPFSLNPRPIPLPLTQAEFQTIPEANEIDRIRIFTLPIIEDDQVMGWIQTMQSLGIADESLDRLGTALIIGSGLLAMLAGIMGYFLAGRAFAPIDEITKTARRISTEDLSARLNMPDTGDEISRLANTFDEMLARIESGFARERQFTADASHELRTPLTVMQTILSLVREGEWSEQEYRQAFDDLADEANRLHGLVEDLLQLARGEGGLELHKDEIDLALLLSDVTDALRLLAENKRLTLTCNLPRSLVISGDTDQLVRLFVNLLDNAIKFTERGSITLSAQERDGYAVVKVVDTGIGIPPEHMAHIFERFYRIDAARSSGGAGLGLSIASQIVLAHGGRLEVQSGVDRGTTLVVYLPR